MDDMHRVFGTGYFSLCTPRAEETRDGIKLTLEVCVGVWVGGVGGVGGDRGGAGWARVCGERGAGRGGGRLPGGAPVGAQSPMCECDVLVGEGYAAATSCRETALRCCCTPAWGCRWPPTPSSGDSPSPGPTCCRR